MTCEEFSNEFDVLLNSYNKIMKFADRQLSGSIELDEYEKSVLLTQAQEELILEYYSGKNPFADSFENTEEIRRYMNELVSTYQTNAKISFEPGVSTKSVFFMKPSEVWFVVYEAVKLSDTALGCRDGQTVIVKPVTHDDFYYMQRNPFKTANGYRAFRLDVKYDMVEIISEYNVDSYYMRYVTQPGPIILVNLGDLAINETSTKTECELNPVLHRSILKRAVELALRRFNVAGN